MMAMCNKRCTTYTVAAVLAIIGGINWGLVGLGGFLGQNLNVVNLLLGGMPTVEWIVYILVGIAAVVMIFGCRCKSCKVADTRESEPMAGPTM